MINFNGVLTDKSDFITPSNRALLYGDAVFETFKVVDNKILFLEDHYFRLMSSMRILRMKIPMNFTLEYLEEQIISLALKLNIAKNARVRMTVFRKDGGLYAPETNEVSFIITAKENLSREYLLKKENYEVELFKDFHVSKHLISSLKTTNKIIQVVASVFAKENGFDDCILINDEKNVVETISGNIFMALDNQIITPPVSDGCLNGIMRKQVINELKSSTDFNVIENSISPFDLQKADELFLTNVITGMQPITKYRKKSYTTEVSEMLLRKINLKNNLV
ncbi:aminotransferase class IV [Flavobacterium sp.]|uniref:aminotransferase class IV n=1 Tax=Flavobacterium sp. TaxID=239 RepID=UPI0035B387D4